MARSSTLAAILLALTRTGCSLGVADVTPCETNADCRASFGLNARCVEDGLCGIEPQAPRCDRTYPEDLYQRADQYADAIVFGNLMDRSAPKKVARENAARLAAMQVSESGGLGGRTLAMVFCTVQPNYLGDGLELGEASLASARYLADVVGVPAIVGPSASGNTLAVFDATREFGTLIMSPAATSPALTDAEPGDRSDENPGLLWRTAPSDSLQGPVIANDMAARNVASVHAIAQSGAYGEGLLAIFEQAAQGTIAEVDSTMFLSSADRAEAITKAGLSSAEEVLFISSESTDIMAFLQAAEANATYESKTLFLTDAAASQDVLDASSTGAFGRVRGTRPAPLEKTEFVYLNFLTAYQAEYGADASVLSFTAHAFDAAWLVFYGTAWADIQGDVVNGRTIALGLRQLSNGLDESYVTASSWQPIQDAFAQGSSVNVRGASGALDFDPKSEEAPAPIEVWLIAPQPGGGFAIEPVL